MRFMAFNNHASSRMVKNPPRPGAMEKSCLENRLNLFFVNLPRKSMESKAENKKYLQVAAKRNIFYQLGGNSMSFIQWLLLAGFIALLLYKVHPAIRKAWQNLHPQKEVHHRMLVAVRRRQTGYTRLLELAPDKQSAALQRLEKSWHAVNEAWGRIALFSGGFSTTDKGLSHQADEDWSFIGFYDVADYEDFIKCQALLEQAEHLALRTHYDIRLTLGKRLSEAPVSLHSLF